MAKQDLSRKSHSVLPEVWWYETNKGIEVYYDGGGAYFQIPWTSIRAALRRKDK